MNILIHSNNIYFNIGLAQCFRDIQETLPGLNIIHSLPLSHLPDPAGLDVIILALENYHDYQAAAELAQRYPGLVVGFTSANNVKRGRAFYADTLLWVSQRESVQEIRRLLLRLADRSRPFAPRHQRQSRSSRLRAPLNDLEMQMIRGGSADSRLIRWQTRWASIASGFTTDWSGSKVIFASPAIPIFIILSPRRPRLAASAPI
ncbi:response regulator receiver protein [Klebsiella quasipneumoniae]|nr:response regulator receiver protein [Klebsiella quasipneumoniae]SLT93085.1 response regulator receiver protein [Klebsiella quasipneumoniae]SLU00424.1 response regulator receiver protein [Klebsiella quasipneumoniae]SLU02212.1 response regulator receiver protein [Klebsiella quasipneumoniae]SLU32062.1 response regulator receiver protein [Klebsiella quasipneumoniae]